jgi:hypothetical protein
MNSWRLQSSTGRVLFKAFLTGTDTPATGKTIAITLSKNGGAFGNPNAGASNATEIANGWYYFAPAAQDRDTLGPVVWRGTEGTIDPAESEELIVDAVRLGITALPNAAADAAGGLPISDAGGLDLDARLDAAVSSRASQTSVDDLPTNAELATSQAAADDATLAAIAALNNLSAAQVRTELATELGRIDVAVSTRASQASVDDVPTNAELATALAAADDAILAQVALVKAKTDALPADPADASDVAAGIAGLASTLSTIVGLIDTEIAAILAAVDTEIAAIKAKTDNLPAAPAAIGDIPTAVQNADALLGRTISGGANGGRTVTSALRALRNKVAIVAGTMTVYEEDDATSAFTAAVTTAAGNPIASIDPA